MNAPLIRFLAHQRPQPLLVMLKRRGICVVDKTEKSLHVKALTSLPPFLSVPPPLDSSVRICYVFPSYKFQNVLYIKPNFLGARQ